jgi:hypothetical protein
VSDLFKAHGLHGLHEWPEVQEQALARLEARREAIEGREAEAAGVIAPPKTDKSRD